MLEGDDFAGLRRESNHPVRRHDAVDAPRRTALRISSTEAAGPIMVTSRQPSGS
jgi:hypothetical protein